MQMQNISPMSERNEGKVRGFWNMNAISVISHHSMVLLGSLMKEWIDLNNVLLEQRGLRNWMNLMVSRKSQA